MWVLATWEPMAIISQPDTEQIKAAIMALDNATSIGLSLFRPIEDVGDERIVIVGGERVSVEYWPAGAAMPSHYMHDAQASRSAVVNINFGEQGRLQYPANETVQHDMAIEAILYFHRRGHIGENMGWTRYPDE
jgi:hypothetical protein